MSPSAPRRWLQSKVMRAMMSPSRLQKQRTAAEAKRQHSGASHQLEYFHQLDDGYSHLAAQTLRALEDRYDVELRCHLVQGPAGRNAPEPQLLLDLARRDAAQVASHYGLAFPAHHQKPDHHALQQATQLLAATRNQNFPEVAVQLGDALFGKTPLPNTIADGSIDPASTNSAVAAGTARRAKLGHYSGGMFYYAGEWYWGVDRLYHLEQRLLELGASRKPDAPFVAPRPPIDMGPRQDKQSLTLEIYPSLRSPYTALIFDKALELGRTTGVQVKVRPVLPMVMRGVPVTPDKGRYIMMDAAREARALCLDFGNIYDPIGEPARRCYAMYPWACEQGRGNELLSAFMQAAFCQGINTNNDRGLRRVVETAGLDWQQAQGQLTDQRWQTLLEANRLAMYDFGAWGVPSFRVLTDTGATSLAVWGQDRLWLVAKEIQRLLQLAS